MTVTIDLGEILTHAASNEAPAPTIRSAPFLDSRTVPGYVPDRAGVGRTPRRLVFGDCLGAPGR